MPAQQAGSPTPGSSQGPGPLPTGGPRRGLTGRAAPPATVLGRLTDHQGGIHTFRGPRHRACTQVTHQGTNYLQSNSDHKPPASWRCQTHLTGASQGSGPYGHLSPAPPSCLRTCAPVRLMHLYARTHARGSMHNPCECRMPDAGQAFLTGVCCSRTGPRHRASSHLPPCRQPQPKVPRPPPPAAATDGGTETHKSPGPARARMERPHPFQLPRLPEILGVLWLAAAPLRPLPLAPARIPAVVLLCELGAIQSPHGHLFT